MMFSRPHEVVYPPLRSANTFFELEWCNGRVCVRAANGKYVIAKKNGQLTATVDNAGEWELKII